MISALFLVGFARRVGAKRVHAIALGLAAVALIWLAHISNQYNRPDLDDRCWASSGRAPSASPT